MYNVPIPDTVLYQIATLPLGHISETIYLYAYFVHFHAIAKV